MGLLQGNTYLLPIRIEDCEGSVVSGEQVEKGEFVVGEVTKFFGGDGEVVWSGERQAFIMPLTEGETFEFKRGVVKYQGRVLLKDGSVNGSVPANEYIYESIGKTTLSDGGVGEESGKILTVRLLDRVINTGITEEVDPTVPEYVKNITEEDIAKWNEGGVSEEQLNTAIANLVNSAPETLDTLGEVAEAIEENADVVSALNSAIGNKVGKTDYATSSVAGVIKASDTYGARVSGSGFLVLEKASNAIIDEKTNAYKPIVPSNLDYAVKVGITTNTNTLTDDEKAQAQSWLGITDLVGDINTALENVLGV